MFNTMKNVKKLPVTLEGFEILEATELKRIFAGDGDDGNNTGGSGGNSSGGSGGSGSGGSGGSGGTNVPPPFTGG